MWSYYVSLKFQNHLMAFWLQRLLLNITISCIWACDKFEETRSSVIQVNVFPARNTIRYIKKPVCEYCLPGIGKGNAHHSDSLHDNIVSILLFVISAFEFLLVNDQLDDFESFKNFNEFFIVHLANGLEKIDFRNITVVVEI